MSARSTTPTSWHSLRMAVRPACRSSSTGAAATTAIGRTTRATSTTPSAGELLDAFLGQFYAERTPPKLVLLSDAPASRDLLAEALAVRAGRKVALLRPHRGEKRQLVEQATLNARQALARKLAESSAQRRLLGQLAERLDLAETPERIEVYDNSHIMGTDALGALIVAGPEG